MDRRLSALKIFIAQQNHVGDIGESTMWANIKIHQIIYLYIYTRYKSTPHGAYYFNGCLVECRSQLDGPYLVACVCDLQFLHYIQISAM